jgi:hypothetical protein
MALSTDLKDAFTAEHIEADGERDARLDRERLLLDEARADVRAGRVISGAALDTWLDLFAQGEPLLPLPLPKR